MIKRFWQFVGLWFLAVALLAPVSQAGVGKAGVKVVKYFATLSAAKAVKQSAQVATYPVRHPKKSAHAARKAAF